MGSLIPIMDFTKPITAIKVPARIKKPSIIDLRPASSTSKTKSANMKTIINAIVSIAYLNALLDVSFVDDIFFFNFKKYYNSYLLMMISFIPNR